jgi:hypothetical protein
LHSNWKMITELMETLCNGNLLQCNGNPLPFNGNPLPFMVTIFEKKGIIIDGNRY